MPKKTKIQAEKTKKNNTPNHKRYRIGEQVAVRFKKAWYVGRYYCWDKGLKEHVVRFPVDGPYGTRLQPFWVKDGSKIDWPS